MRSLVAPVLALLFMAGVGSIVSATIESNRYNTPTKTFRLI